MATIAEAVAKGILEKVALPEWEKRQPVRMLYAAPQFLDSIECDAALRDASKKSGGRVLYEHLWQMLCDFRCAKRPGAGDLRRMEPTKKGIWTMRPMKLRLYGWVPALHSFVIVDWAYEAETKKDKSLNNKKRDAVLGFIKTNKLEETKLLGDILALFPH
jgi:hypothetical protein